jgi:hypothetical protein
MRLMPVVICDMCVHGCRYNMLGLVTHKVAAEMRRPEVNDFFARLIQRTSPKSYTQVGHLTSPLCPQPSTAVPSHSRARPSEGGTMGCIMPARPGLPPTPHT